MRRFRDWYDNAGVSKFPNKRTATGTTRLNIENGGDANMTASKVLLQGSGYATSPGLSPENSSLKENHADGKDDSDFQEFRPSDLEDRIYGIPNSSQFDIASSANEEVKISLNCNSSGNPSFRNQNLNEVLRVVEDEYCRTYRIPIPGFSLVKLMKRICECFLEFDTDSRNGPLHQDFDSLKKSVGKDLGSNDDIQCKASPNLSQLNKIVHCPDIFQVGANDKSMKVIKVEVLENLQSSNLPTVEAVSQKKYPIYLKDVSRGEEKMQFPLVNEYGALELPNFLYIKKNMVHKDAHVDLSLARISENNFCAQCYGDCLSSALPCACAGETRGEFAYTRQGLVKEEFLDECIAMSREPERKYFYYCEICPMQNDLNRKKSRRIKPCKGHLMRKFIKECWSKCGCSRKCRNRVVQHGIQVALQVFATPEGKGWGVRSVNALKKGTFVCEYVGEIVTNQELYERNKERATKQEKHTDPVLLDADWGSEQILKDEEALCLDATEFGNVARFVNHRCHDPNLIEIPVEVESPDHHYYHDYGIAFDDKFHPIKAFKCKCGSTYCRDRTNP
ncbi:set domain protein, putative [Ricinus communis]|uniref:Set domain protein, putative n=1 Tax=Ricinus communis TaxID=3988 RepID=B9S5I0_RICCO|nr:set domain protein, putative [Ricinus communis]